MFTRHQLETMRDEAIRTARALDQILSTPDEQPRTALGKDGKYHVIEYPRARVYEFTPPLIAGSRLISRIELIPRIAGAQLSREPLQTSSMSDEDKLAYIARLERELRESSPNPQSRK